MTQQSITFAPQERIDAYEDVGTEFLRGVLGLEWSECLVTDESRLSDFGGAGLPEDLSEHTQSLGALYDVWDAWVTTQVRDRYGVELGATTVYLVDLFRLIEQAKLEGAARKPERLN